MNQSFKKKLTVAVFLAVFILSNLLTGLIVYFATRPQEVSGPMTQEELFAKFAPSVCSINSGGEAGTGFLAAISPESGGQRTLYIATAAHTVDSLIASPDTAAVVVKFYQETDSYQNAEIQIAGYDIYHDIAVLAVTDKSPQKSRSIILGSVNNHIAPAAQILLIGNMSGEGIAVFTHTNASVSDTDAVPHFIEKSRYETLYGVSVDVNGGCSGGPIFDMYGNFVGIGKAQAFSQGLPTAGHSFAVPSAIAVPLIQKAITARDGGEIHKVDGWMISNDTANLSELDLVVQKKDGRFVIANTPLPHQINGGPFLTGDVIVSFGRVSAEEPSFTALFGELARYANGNKPVPSALENKFTENKLTIVIVRGGVRQTVEYENIRELSL